MSITVSARKVLTITADHSLKNTIAMVVELGGHNPLDVIALMVMYNACKNYMNSLAWYFFQIATENGGNPIYTDLILEHNITHGPSITAFEADADIVYNGNHTFSDLNAITLPTNKIPYAGADALLSEFITFQD